VREAMGSGTRAVARLRNHLARLDDSVSGAPPPPPRGSAAADGAKSVGTIGRAAPRAKVSEPDPGADVAGVGPVPAQMWQGWTQSWYRCGLTRGA
jgi:hypothetical protein